MIYKRHKREYSINLLLVFVICFAVISTISAQTSGNYAIRKWVVNGGGNLSSSENHTMQDACAQPSAIGYMTSENYGSSSGFYGKDEMGTSVGGEGKVPAEEPGSFRLFQNYPNPFNPETCIEFDLSGKAEVILTVYDLQGKEINRLVQGNQAAGKHTVIWRGKDFSGNTVSSGMYIYRIIIRSQGSGSKTLVKEKKMIYMK